MLKEIIEEIKSIIKDKLIVLKIEEFLCECIDKYDICKNDIRKNNMEISKRKLVFAAILATVIINIIICRMVSFINLKIRNAFVAQNVNDKIAITIGAAIACNNVMNNIKSEMKHISTNIYNNL